MKKSVVLELNKVATVPNGLRLDRPVNKASPEVVIDVTKLCHHLYFDIHGRVPPDRNFLFDHYHGFLANTPDYRYLGAGLASHKQARIEESGRFGKAFCRYMLYEHFNQLYFAHVDDVLDQTLHPGLGEMRLVRTQKGDAPDYLCARNVSNLVLGEAKGRTTSVSFASKEFQKWRQQFDRVELQDKNGNPHAVKGFIVATRTTCQQDSPKVKSKVLVEDPATSGSEQFMGGDYPPDPARMVIAAHYASAMDKIGQSLMATALRGAFTIPPEVRFPIAVWECLIPPLNGLRFVGGFFPDFGDCRSESFWRFALEVGWPFVWHGINLAMSGVTFVGVELDRFKVLVSAVRRGREALDAMTPVDVGGPVPSAMSFLVDGTLLAPVEFMRLVETLEV